MTRKIERLTMLHLIDDALDNDKRGSTVHLHGSDHGRFIVGGVAPSIRLPLHQVRHPATVNFLTDKVNALLGDYPRAETVGSWRDQFSGDIYIDLGTTHEDRRDAQYAAVNRKERAIFDSHDDAVEWV